MPVVADDIAADASAAPRRLPLRTNFAWTLAGNVVYAGCQWGMLVALAKLGTPEKVGQFALGLAVTAPVVMFSQLQLRAVQATDAKREYQFGDYLALRLLTTALALLAIAGIVAVAGYSRETALVVLIVGGIKAVDSLSDVYYGLWQQHERMDGIARAMIVNGVVSVAALAALMAATRNIVAATLGSALGSLAAWLYTLARNRRLALATGAAARPRWHPPTLKRLAWLAMPLGVTTMLISLNANVPRYAIGGTQGEKELGIYAAIAYFNLVGGTIVSALGQSISPRLARLYSSRDTRGFSRLLRRAIALGLGIGLFGLAASMLYGRSILLCVYGSAYASRVDVMVVLMISATVAYSGSLVITALTATKQLAAQIPMYLGAVSTTFALSLSLIPAIGIAGAAWASVASMAVLLLWSSTILARTLRLSLLQTGYEHEYRAY